MFLQPVSASSRLAATILLWPVQPADRGAAKVPSQGPLWDRGQPRGGEGAVRRPPCGTGMSPTLLVSNSYLRSSLLSARDKVSFVCLSCVPFYCHYSIRVNTDKCSLINCRLFQFPRPEQASDTDVWLLLTLWQPAVTEQIELHTDISRNSDSFDVFLFVI